MDYLHSLEVPDRVGRSPHVLQFGSRVLARIFKMLDQNSNFKMSAHPERRFSGNCLSRRQAGRVLAKSLFGSDTGLQK